ncbi:MAG TPA: hydrolase [Pseudonocardiaceae bacterium]
MSKTLRKLVLLALVLDLTVPVAGSLDGPIELRLPAPSGPLPVGTTTLHLVERSRADPWVPSARPRELMITLFYPARPGDTRPLAPWMSRLAANHYLARISGRTRPPLDLPRVPSTHSGENAPAASRPGGWPVVLFSPGYGEDRALGTDLTEDLASHGYVVAAIDHTYDATEIAFPKDRLVLRHQPEPTTEVLTAGIRTRVADARFVLDELASLNHGDNPDAEGRTLPQGTRLWLNLARVGMFGHSLGGATTAAAMAEDPRIKAGVDLDGTLHGSVSDYALNRPFLFMSRQGHSHLTDPTWSAFWTHLTAWHIEVQLTGSAHYTFTDNETLLPQMTGVLGLTAAQLQTLDGTIEPQRAVDTERAYLAAFFDLTLTCRDDGLLSGRSPRFPDAALIA